MKTVLNVKMDREVKEGATQLAREMGVPLSVVVNAQLKEFVRSRQVTLSAIPRMTPYLEKLTGKVLNDSAHGKNIVGPFKTNKEMRAYLDA